MYMYMYLPYSMIRKKKLHLAATLIIGALCLFILHSKCGTKGTSDSHAPSITLLDKWIIYSQSPDTRNPCADLPQGWTGLLWSWEGDDSRIDRSDVACHYVGSGIVKRLVQNAHHNGQHHNGQHHIHTSDVKIQAILYAINHGADVLYLASTEHHPPFLHSDVLKHLDNTDSCRSLVVSESDTWMQADQHFGCVLQKESQSIDYAICTHPTPGIFAQAIRTHPAQEVSCDRMAPPITLQHHVLTDIALQAGSVFTKEAFWALPFYDHASFSSRDLQTWSYVTQYILHLVNRPVMVYGVTNQESIINKEQYAIIKSNLKLDCKKMGFLTCISKIVGILESENLISPEFSDELDLYFNYLNSSSYDFPKLQFPMSEIETQCDVTNVRYKAVPMIKDQNDVPTYKVTNLNLSKAIVQDLCHFYKLPNHVKVNLTTPWMQYHDKVLIVIFNNQHYNVIPYLEVLYRSFFPHIVYCGPGYPESRLLRTYQYTFVSYGANPEGYDAGSFSYICPAMVMSMRYNTTGYLVIADDILLSILGMQGFPSNQIWYLPKSDIKIADITTFRECRLGICDFYPRWNWWLAYKNQTMEVYRELFGNQQQSPFLEMCKERLRAFTGASERVCGAYSDIYYIPKRYVYNFTRLIQPFYKHRVFCEITIPTILQSIEQADQIYPLQGHIEWSSNREFPWLYFNNHYLLDKVFLHPVKWSYIDDGSSEHAQFFCTNVLPFLHDRFGRIS